MMEEDDNGMSSTTVEASPRNNLDASGYYRSFPSISVNDTGQSPECSICSERYDDSDEDLIPRNLACGHSMCSKCIFRCMYLSGEQVEDGTTISCPSKCSQITLVPGGLISNLPKNYAVLDIVQDVRERTTSFLINRSRSPSIPMANNGLCASTSNLTATASGVDEYECDVCEMSGAAIVCPSCAVCLCTSCSDDIHSRKGYHIHQLIPVSEYMSDCLTSGGSTGSTDGGFRQRTNSELSDERTCKYHGGEQTEYVCETCCEEICKICQFSAEHKEHECRPISDITKEKKEALRQAIEAIEDCHSIWNKGFDECHELQEQLYVKSRQIETDIKTHFHAIHSLLHAKEESLLSHVREAVEARVKTLQAQADHLAKVCAIAKDLTEDCEELLHHCSNYEVVRKADATLAQSKQYTLSEQNVTPVVTCSMEMDFTNEEQLLQQVETLGELLVSPGKIEDLKVESTTSTVSEVTLTWKPPVATSPTKETSYIVEHSNNRTGSGFKIIYEGKALEYVLEDNQFNEDTLHRFRVAAVNEIGRGPYSTPVHLTRTRASFLWDGNLKHPKAHISNNGYSVSIGENATWVSVGTNTVLSHGRHYWEVVLDRYGSASLSRKVVIGVVSSDYSQWHRSHGVIGIKTCPIGSRSWGLACGTAKKLSSASTFFNSIGRKHNLFKEGDSVGVLLDFNEHILAFYRNGEPLGLQFCDIYGPVIPAISFCRNKALTLRFPPPPEHHHMTLPIRSSLARRNCIRKAETPVSATATTDVSSPPMTMKTSESVPNIIDNTAS